MDLVIFRANGLPMSPGTVEILQWLIPATCLGSTAYVLLDNTLVQWRHIIGMFLNSTLASSSVGLAVYTWTSDHTWAVLGGLGCSLGGPKVYGLWIAHLQRKFSPPDGDKQEAPKTKTPPKSWR